MRALASKKRILVPILVVLLLLMAALWYTTTNELSPLMYRQLQRFQGYGKPVGKTDNDTMPPVTSHRPSTRLPPLVRSAPLLKTIPEQTKAVTTLFRMLIKDPPEYGCRDPHRIQNQVEGSWTTCADKDFNITPPCLVYSFGIAYDFTFDDAFGKLGCEVFSFDPSMNMTDHRRSQQVMFYQTGLGGQDTDTFEPHLDSYVKKKTFWKIRTLKSLLSTLNHTNRTIDVLKIDIESSEWAAVRDILDTGVARQVKQLLLEWHIFPTYPARETFQQLIAVLRDLEKTGFKPFQKHPHPYNLSWKQLNLQSDYGYVNTRFAKH